MINDEIEVLSEIEAVRKNPAMFIGSVGPEGPHHLLLELVYNALDEWQLGRCDQIDVTVGDEFSEVADNGHGLPVAVHSKLGISNCEVALTRLHSGSKFRSSKEVYTSGMHGVGLSCVNALSDSLEVTIDREGRRYQQSYRKGFAQFPLRDLAPSSERGTRIRFSPDREIFRDFDRFAAADCQSLLQDLAFLNPGVRLSFGSFLDERRQVFECEGDGLSQLVKKYSEGRRLILPEELKVSAQLPQLRFDAKLNWCTDQESQIQSFVNCVKTTEGGTHVSGLRAGLVRALNQWVSGTGRTSIADGAIEVGEVSEGLFAVLDLRMEAPQFSGQIKTRLTNGDVALTVERAVHKQLIEFFNAHPGVASVLVDRIHETRQARLAARRVAERVFFQQGRREINEEIYKDQFGARSKNWHDSAVWLTDQQLLKAHADLCQINEDSIALDVCCGSGVVGAAFRGQVKKVIGLDLTPEMVQLAKQRLDEVHQGNVYHLPFADNTFDLVCTREVLHLLPYPERPVSEIYRVLKPGGQFIVGQILPFGEDDAAWMYRVFKKKQPLIFNMFQEEDFRRLLLSPGFVNLEMNELNVWESIDVWINSYETTAIHRHEIRELFRQAPAEARAIHPFKILPTGEIQDLWRWCIFSVRKPR